jgi:integrase/recombinase XerC
MIDRGLAPATVNRRLAALRSLVKLARTVGLVPWQLELPNVRRLAYRDTTGPGVDVVRRMLEALAGMPRDYAILRLLYDLGLRRGEVVGLDFEHLDLEAGTVSVMGKGQAERAKLSLPRQTREALAGWVAVRGTGEGPLFLNRDRARKGSRLTGTSLYRIVKELGKRVGVRVHPHALRHTAITRACQAAQASGLPLEEVLDFSRHKDVKTLMVYRDRARDVQGRIAAMVADDVMVRNASDGA